jgi:hypothetical protein
MSSQPVVSGEPLTSQQDTARTRSWWQRVKGAASFVDSELSFVKSLSAFTVLSSLVVGYFQYVSAYQAKVNAEAAHQIADAENTFSDVSSQFSKAITLQQYLFFNYRDALAAKVDGDQNVLPAKAAHAIYQQYDELRTALRENVDLLARKVELNLDWHSNVARDAATVPAIGTDPVTRLALGHYDFDCDSDKYMPSFEPGQSRANIDATAAVLHDNPRAHALTLDWFSTKHHLLTMYYCFEVDHNRIEAAREWAAASSVSPAAKSKFEKSLTAIQLGFNREAIRLNAFMTLAARRIENIQVKFRPRGWYCHVPVLREIADGLTGKCSPIRTAGGTSTASSSADQETAQTGATGRG